MIVKRQLSIILPLFLLSALSLQACVPPTETQAVSTQPDQAAGEIPTWTPRSEDLTQAALPTATEPVSVLEEPTATVAMTNTPASTPTPETVTFRLSGGNLNVRRGPSLYYNYVTVLYDGDIALAVGRDRISRWLMIELPGDPEGRGWVTTETKYSIIDGDIGSLPFITVEPAVPAIIRNCTNHKMWIMPDGIQLLSKFEEPDNEDRFTIGGHQVYDLENPDSKSIVDIVLAEGKTVDIQLNWEGIKSKCE